MDPVEYKIYINYGTGQDVRDTALARAVGTDVHNLFAEVVFQINADQTEISYAPSGEVIDMSVTHDATLANTIASMDNFAHQRLVSHGEAYSRQPAGHLEPHGPNPVMSELENKLSAKNRGLKPTSASTSL